MNYKTMMMSLAWQFVKENEMSMSDAMQCA